MKGLLVSLVFGLVVWGGAVGAVDMLDDASNAKLPDALSNLGLQTPAICDGFNGPADGVLALAGGGVKQFSAASKTFTSADIGKKITIRKAGVKQFMTSATISAGGTGHAVGDLIHLSDGAVVFVTAVSGGAVTKFYIVNVGSSASAPTSIAQAAGTVTATGSVKSGSTLASPVAAGTGLVLTPVWVRENHVSTISAITGGAATLADVGVAASGQYWAYGTDFGPAIQAKLGINTPVYLPQGVCGIGDTLTITSPDSLLGKGASGGGSTLLYLGSPNKPQISLGATSRVTGAQFGHFTLDGMGAASKGLYMRGATSNVVWDIYMIGHTTVGLDIHASDNGLDSIKNWFQRLDIAESESYGSELNTHGVWWGFPNTYYIGADHDLSTYGPVQTKTVTAGGVGLVCGAADHNTVQYLQTRTSGSPGVEMLGSNWAVLGHCRSNQIYGMDAGVGGLTVRSTGYAKKPSNTVNWYDKENGAPDATVESGAKLTLRSGEGRYESVSLKPRGYSLLEATPYEGTLDFVQDASTANPGAIVAAGGGNRVPVYYDGTDWRVGMQTKPRAVLNGSPASPAGTASTGFVMQGLAAWLTPAVSGNVAVTISGTVANSAAGGNARIRMRHGSGTAPANGVAETGTTACAGTPQQSFDSATAAQRTPFSMTCIVSGLTLGDAHWFDLALASSASSTALLTGVSVQASEQ